MRRMSFVVLALVLGGGCADSARELNSGANASKPAASSPAGEARKPQDSQDHSAQSKAGALGAVTATEDSSVVNAEVLLASTLQQARTEDKRVMVHLGAPW